MTMMIDTSPIFEFERDFSGDLRCIPMIVRFKLDLCGIKLSLRQWSRFDGPERRQLVDRPCGGACQTAAYRAYLEGLIEVRAREAPVSLAVEAHPAWDDRTVVPDGIQAQTKIRGLPPLHVGAWSAHEPLQRFALLKLSREGHDNDNFEPALREFGLA